MILVMPSREFRSGGWYDSVSLPTLVSCSMEHCSHESDWTLVLFILEFSADLTPSHLSGRIVLELRATRVAGW